METEQYLKPTTIGKQLNISANTIYNWEKAGLVKSHFVGDDLYKRYNLNEVIKVYENCEKYRRIQRKNAQKQQLPIEHKEEPAQKEIIGGQTNYDMNAELIRRLYDYNDGIAVASNRLLETYKSIGDATLQLDSLVSLLNKMVKAQNERFNKPDNGKV